MPTTEADQSSWQVQSPPFSSQRLVLTGLSAVLICDQEYPVRPAYSLLTKALDDFSAKVPQSSYSNPSSISFPELQSYVEKYQDPRQADTIMRVQQELDETKIVLVRFDPQRLST